MTLIEQLEELAKKLDEFPMFFSTDGAHWLKSNEKEPLCIESAKSIRQAISELKDKDVRKKKELRLLKEVSEYYDQVFEKGLKSPWDFTEQRKLEIALDLRAMIEAKP